MNTFARVFALFADYCSKISGWNEAHTMAKLVPVEVFDLIIFGGTGDLAMRKLLPALYHRHGDGQITGDSRIVAAGRSALTRKKYLDTVRQALKDNLADGEFDAGQWKSFAGRTTLRYQTRSFATNYCR